MTESTPHELQGAAAVEYARRLRKLRVDPDTWQVEFVDDATGERWLMDYPQSELQGGGEPRLRRMP